MIIHRLAHERGRTELDWLDSRHSFAFGAYHDPAWRGFGPLRVINDDHIKPGAGFGMHRHRDMEIISWVVDGKLAHRDSLDHEGLIEHGMAQVMTAGRGIRHSEFNPEPEKPVHLLQIWIKPRQRGLEPKYADRQSDPADRRDRFDIIASPDGRANSLTIQQDALVHVADLSPGATIDYTFAPDRLGWIQIAQGQARLNTSLALEEGDAAALRHETQISLHNPGSSPTQLILFDLPPDSV
ncbi:MAG: pirin family protein [Phycisphaeraceae bacterium]